MINLLYDHICAVHWEKYETTRSKEWWRMETQRSPRMDVSYMVTLTYQPSEEIFVSIIEVNICVP